MSWCRLDMDVHKILSCKVSFKCRCQGASKLLIENFEHGCNQVLLKWYFREKKPWQRRKLFWSNWPYNVASKHKNKNENTKYHGICISFKSHLYSKQESPIFLLFGSWSLTLYLLVWVASSKNLDQSDLFSWSEKHFIIFIFIR